MKLVALDRRIALLTKNAAKYRNSTSDAKRRLYAKIHAELTYHRSVRGRRIRASRQTFFGVSGLQRARPKEATIVCGCGSVLKQTSYKGHLTSKKHTRWAATNSRDDAAEARPAKRKRCDDAAEARPAKRKRCDDAAEARPAKRRKPSQE
jgi:hypothetical protein